MNIKNKYDRLIIIISLGVLVVASTFSASVVFRQNVAKKNQRAQVIEHAISETVNVKIWRLYHQQQMHMLNQINARLTKLEAQQMPVSTVSEEF